MKKKIVWIIMAGLLLLASCKPKHGAGPIEMPADNNTPTPIVVPTCTPTAGPSPKPALHPTTDPTKKPTAEPTREVLPSPSPMPTVTPEPTMTLSPEPMSSPSPAPTLTPTPSPSPSPMPTATPSPIPSPTLSPSPTPSPLPTPTVNPELLVTNGWQKTISIDENYVIIFPELYNESAVSKTDRELAVRYSCNTKEDIAFEISYGMHQNLSDIVMDILGANGIVYDEVPGQKRISYRWRLGDTMYRGILIEAQYPQSLLGASFGEEEWVTGVMKIIFSYPVEQSAIYEAEEYSYYVIENREE